MSQFVNIYRNGETLSYQPLTNSDISNSINLAQESCCFGTQDSYSSFLVQNKKPAILKKSMKLLRKSERHSQNILNSPFSHNQASHTSYSEHPTVKNSILEMSMEALREFEQQSQNLMDSRLHHNFQNQLSYSQFQKEPIAKSIEDMIQT